VLGLAGTGGVTFISTNAADVSEGIQMGGPVSFAHLPRIMGLTAGRPWPTILETLKTHPSVGSYLNLLWSKFGMLWRWFEAPDNCNLYHFQLFSAVLRFLPVTFFLLSPLAMTGLVLALPRFSRCWPLYLYVVSLAALLMVFCPLSRWRLPMVAAVIPLAGLTTVSIGQWLVSGQLGRGCAALLAVTLIALWTSRPLPPGVPPVRPADCTGSFQAYYLPEAERAWRAGDLPRVIALFSDFVQHEPGAVKRLDAARPAQSVLEAQLAQLYAEARMELADLLLRAGRKKAAALHQQRAGELFRAAPNWR
jgi:hypothetical protein